MIMILHNDLIFIAPYAHMDIESYYVQSTWKFKTYDLENGFTFQQNCIGFG